LLNITIFISVNVAVKIGAFAKIAPLFCRSIVFECRSKSKRAICTDGSFFSLCSMFLYKRSSYFYAL